MIVYTPRVRRVLFAVLFSLGCQSHPATQVVVNLRADASLRLDAAEIRVVVEGADGSVVFDGTRAVSVAGSALARIPLVPEGGDAARVFRLTATLLDDQAQPFARVEVTSSYVADALREIDVWFEESCRGQLCEAGRTCVQGVCVGSCFDPAQPDTAAVSTPVCGECELCSGGACSNRPDGDPCGCAGTDQCAGGRCATSMPVASVQPGQLHTCAGIRGGNVWCWGSDRVGQVGTSASGGPEPQDTLFGGQDDGTSGKDHSCWLKHNGDRECWGWNGGGQLGLGTRETMAYQTPEPPPVSELPWSEIDAGWYFNCALEEAGGISCWGENSRGQIGIPAGEGIPTPTPIDDAQDWVAVSAGGFTACGLKNDGTLWCWGFNDSGQLGVGDKDNRLDPVQVGCPDAACFSDWKAVSVGSFHVCALRESGELWCWGGGLNGQLGVGPTATQDSARPLRVEKEGWRAVSAGGSHTCGVATDGSLWCWGANGWGQLGVQDFERRFVPVQVSAPGNSEWVRVSAGLSHTCAIRSNESLWCWGRNENGQLALGFTSAGPDISTAQPRQVCFP